MKTNSIQESSAFSPEAFLRRIDERLEKMELRLRKVELKSRQKKEAKPKPEKSEPQEELYVGDVFLPIMDVLEEWNNDRRTLLRTQ